MPPGGGLGTILHLFFLPLCDKHLEQKPRAECQGRAEPCARTGPANAPQSLKNAEEKAKAAGDGDIVVMSRASASAEYFYPLHPRYPQRALWRQGFFFWSPFCFFFFLASCARMLGRFGPFQPYDVELSILLVAAWPSRNGVGKCVFPCFSLDWTPGSCDNHIRAVGIRLGRIGTLRHRRLANGRARAIRRSDCSPSAER